MSGSGISWAICKSAPCSRQIITPAPHRSVFYRPDALPVAQPTVSKHWRHCCPVLLCTGQQLSDISCLPGSQQQTCSSRFLLEQTRWTDTVPLEIWHCSAYYMQAVPLNVWLYTRWKCSLTTVTIHESKQTAVTWLVMCRSLNPNSHVVVIWQF